MNVEDWTEKNVDKMGKRYSLCTNLTGYWHSPKRNDLMWAYKQNGHSEGTRRKGRNSKNLWEEHWQKLHWEIDFGRASSSQISLEHSMFNYSNWILYVLNSKTCQAISLKHPCIHIIMAKFLSEIFIRLPFSHSRLRGHKQW